MGWDPRADAWFAGFADGEATFLIAYAAAPGNPAGRKPCLYPRFSLNLRADDVGVLRELRESFGGTLNFSARERTAPHPRWFWHITAKADLRCLVAYFDEFPLRAKKAADFAVWRRAVEVYCERGGVAGFDELDALRGSLSEARVYAEPVSLHAVGAS